MGNLMANVTQQRAIRFVQIDAAAFTFSVIGFGDVDGDSAVGVAGGDGLAGQVGGKLKAQRRAILLGNPLDGQMETKDRVKYATLGVFELVPAFEITGRRKIGNQDVKAARGAKRVGIVGWRHPVANFMEAAVFAEAEFLFWVG